MSSLLVKGEKTAMNNSDRFDTFTEQARKVLKLAYFAGRLADGSGPKAPLPIIHCAGATANSRSLPKPSRTRCSCSVEVPAGWK